jgi:hypothetical protein
MIDSYVLLGAYALDWVAGDPRWLPHPVRLMGRAARWGESFARRWARKPLAEMAAGALVSSVVIGVSSVAAHGLIRLAGHANPFLGSRSKPCWPGRLSPPEVWCRKQGTRWRRSNRAICRPPARAWR